jgi:hypothetical protein
MGKPWENGDLIGKPWYIKAGWWFYNHHEKYEFINGKDDIPYMKNGK